MPGEARLGRADRLGDDDVWQRRGAGILDRRGEQRRAGRHGQQRRGVVPARAVGLDERPGHRVADDHQQVDLAALDRAPDLVRVKVRQQDDSVAGEQAGQRRDLRVAVDDRRGAEPDQPAALSAAAGLLPLVGQRDAGGEVDAAAEGAPDVLMPPHDPLGVPGRPAGIDDVDVVAAARREVAVRRRRRQRGLVLGPVAGLGVAAVLDHHRAAQPGRVGRHGGDPRRELPVVHQRDQVRVGEHVPQLVLDVPVVDVDGGRAELARRDQRLDGLDGIARVEPDVIPRLPPRSRPGDAPAGSMRSSSSR